MKRTTHLTFALALTAALGLSACADEADTTPAGETTATQESDAPVVATPDATDDDAGTDEADDSATEDSTDDSTTDAGAAAATTGDGAGATGAAGGEELTTAALAAIDTAEAETGGVAYEIDDQDDDGTWEVDVRVDDRSIEVTVSADGSTVEGTEDDDLDDDDRAGLDAATITLVEAIETAVGEAGGHLDDAELDEENGTHLWEISLDGTDAGDDVDVLVSVTGEVVSSDA